VLRPARRRLCLLALGTAAIALYTSANADAGPRCSQGPATRALVGRPSVGLAWRAELLAPTPTYAFLSQVGGRQRGSVSSAQAPWLLVLSASERAGRCWVRVRMTMRPNRASAWLAAARVLLRPSPWSIHVSRVRRTLTVDRGGVRVARMRVVVGAAATPTPVGLFSIVGAWRSSPMSFLGSWILALTAHSEVLRTFAGGDGTIGIHGRGGTSLLDPLGAARSHGCIRLANSAIDWLVHTIGVADLPGIPVWVT
jgi:hypothetical protein